MGQSLLGLFLHSRFNSKIAKPQPDCRRLVFTVTFRHPCLFRSKTSHEWSLGSNGLGRSNVITTPTFATKTSTGVRMCVSSMCSQFKYAIPAWQQMFWFYPIFQTVRLSVYLASGRCSPHGVACMRCMSSRELRSTSGPGNGGCFQN